MLRTMEVHMSRSPLMLVAAIAVCGSEVLFGGPAHATSRADAIRRCGEQIGCKVIRERNGDVVIIVDDVDGDGKGGGVIRCPANTGTCAPMRKQPDQPRNPRLDDAPVRR
jgi:hypothetical protein